MMRPGCLFCRESVPVEFYNDLDTLILTIDLSMSIGGLVSDPGLGSYSADEEGNSKSLQFNWGGG